MPAPLAQPSDVEDVWRPLSPAEVEQVTNLIAIASAKLRRAYPFDLDGRIALYTADPTNPSALDPIIVANIVATIVKRFMVNTGGLATASESVGPYSYSQSFSKNSADGIVITAGDLAELGVDVRGKVGMIQLAPTQAMLPRSSWWPAGTSIDPNTGEPFWPYGLGQSLDDEVGP